MSESTSRVSTDGSGYVKSSPTSTRSQVDAEDDDRGNIASETGHTLSETEPYRLPFRTSHLQVDYQEPRRIGSGQSSVSLGATTTTEPSAETANLPQTRKQSTWTLPSLPFSRASTQTTQSSFSARPKISFSQCSSLDNILRSVELAFHPSGASGSQTQVDDIPDKYTDTWVDIERVRPNENIHALLYSSNQARRL